MKCDPAIAYERVKKRGRPEETIPIEYLEKCHHYHETWMKTLHPIIMNANENVYENPEVVKEWIRLMDELM